MDNQLFPDLLFQCADVLFNPAIDRTKLKINDPTVSQIISDCKDINLDSILALFIKNFPKLKNDPIFKKENILKMKL